MIDFVKELSACRVEGTQLPFYPEKVQGYTEQEIDLIAEHCNINIHGQFREFLLQMGKCSGGLVWGEEFYMYKNLWSPNKFIHAQQSEKADLGYILTSKGKLDPVDMKMFYLSKEYETYFYYLLTAENDDFIWSLHDADDCVLEKTNITLLEYLKDYVFQKTKDTRFINFDLTEEQINRSITGRLL
ncbi:SMI1/KNR4 family protein [Acinetobacter baumannii]|uniref:CdiI n=1 Tax=Acinetobacter baumannii TaxID=470 RepID=A0A4Y5U2C0_ACIBA|nr:SMI1/KNR4 family protein [Acinetobacter baumannii]MCZ3153916.1 SMI1/KNR4 family protein [Acinetobacter baumannii]MDE5409145.1 SMI1/KNR4 family protein [Acinetobacter baumannii]MDV7427142.1 SMI1/KNR4 family protein [Acinetobacter baumannii]MDV7546615.1 SMI1/KNR4 family protein [Acinetobacter baumannii]QDC12538.1 CdiI [Acinetobacter baumannii]